MIIVTGIVKKFRFFKNEIANVIPNNESRIAFAKILGACMQLKNFKHRYFTEFEDAIEWWSDIS